jgi:hypothetical protein
MKITKKIVTKASNAYAKKRNPARWDGEPWGEAGRLNHEAAIRAALEVIFNDYKHCTERRKA